MSSQRPNKYFRRRANTASTSSAQNVVMKYSLGIIKNQAQANLFLLVLCIFVLILAFQTSNRSKSEEIPTKYRFNPTTIKSEEQLYGKK